MLTASRFARRVLTRETVLVARSFLSSTADVDRERTAPPEFKSLVQKAASRPPYDPKFQQAVQQIQQHYPDATPAQIQSAAGDHKVLAPLLTALRKRPVPFVSVDPVLEAAKKRYHERQEILYAFLEVNGYTPGILNDLKKALIVLQKKDKDLYGIPKDETDYKELLEDLQAAIIVYEAKPTRLSQLSNSGMFGVHSRGHCYSTKAGFQPVSEEEKRNFERLVRWTHKLPLEHPSMPSIAAGLEAHIEKIGAANFLAMTRGLDGKYGPVFKVLRVYSQTQTTKEAVAPEPKVYVRMSHFDCTKELKDYGPGALYTLGENSEQIPCSPTPPSASSSPSLGN